MENEGCLFVAVFGKIRDLGVGKEDASGLAVKVGGNYIPIGDLTREFISSQCPTYAGKPKIFCVLDTETTTDYYHHASPSYHINIDQKAFQINTHFG